MLTQFLQNKSYFKFNSNRELGSPQSSSEINQAEIQANRDAETEQLERWDKGEETSEQKLKRRIDLAKVAIIGGAALLGTGKLLDNIFIPRDTPQQPVEIKYSYPKPISEAQKLKNLEHRKIHGDKTDKRYFK